MNKQNDSGALPIELANKISRWNFDKSVAKILELAPQWLKITAQVTRELYIAKEFLTNQKGQHRNPDAPNYIEYTWDGYCGAIGFSRQIADFWVKKFIPREISNNRKDVLLLNAPAKIESTADRALMEARINEAIRTGVFPADWTKEENAEHKRKMESARFAILAEKYDAPAIAKTKTDYFDTVLKRSKDIINFSLETDWQVMAQLKIFKQINEYLETFEKPEIRINAAFNVAIKARNLANELAEQYFRSIESVQAKEEEYDS
jgi:hypothetical protein